MNTSLGFIKDLKHNILSIKDVRKIMSRYKDVCFYSSSECEEYITFTYFHKEFTIDLFFDKIDGKDKIKFFEISIYDFK